MSDIRYELQRTPLRDLLPVSTLFCADVRNALVRAAKAPIANRARTIAIEKAIDLARRTQPHLFKQEQ